MKIARSFRFLLDVNPKPGGGGILRDKKARDDRRKS